MTPSEAAVTMMTLAAGLLLALVVLVVVAIVWRGRGQ